MAQRSADRRFHPALSSLPDEDFRADLPETPKTPQKSPQTRGPPAGVSANCEKKTTPTDALLERPLFIQPQLPF